MGDIDVRFYVSILLRRLPYLVAITAVSTVLGITVALLMPRVYQSTAKILVEPPQIPAEMVQSTVPTSSLEQLQIIQQQITTRDNLIELAGKLDVYGGQEEKPSADNIVKDMRSRITFDELQMGGPTVFSVSFQADTPVLSTTVANELAALILRNSQRQRTDRADDTLQLFDDQVSRLAAELDMIEADLLKFKTANKDTLPESLEFRRTQQTSQQERLMALEREESDLRTRRSALVETYLATGQYSNAGPLTAEQQMLMDLNRALAEQLAIFSENSPNIVALRARIAALRTEQEPQDERAANKKTPSGLDLQLADVDRRLKSIEGERALITKSIADLTQSINATPATEASLNALTRNQANLQMQYNTAIAKRAEASLGKQVEVRADGGRFSLLESATPPEKPMQSRRRLIAAAGVMGGLGLGFGLVVLLEMLNRTIRRPTELVQLLQNQPLAVIPYIAAPNERRAFQLRRGATAAMLLLMVPPQSLVAIHHHASLAPSIENVASPNSLGAKQHLPISRDQL
ncbi:Wzz/FepE/Etk N-terminal domain-containing protein [Rhizobiaceae bacterium n13]|uniref:Wzz/FepE/Etk N-terminal domain-containing protein n=1 Tax=Ferirhizobium litorale TaxID=2927786 RepID=A0AAE3Q9N6_9HYPH|nr:Wzz/FepE/Etk N-terminal domain-containing protein [Fererhizobium litorale]MDI7860742.1 Wzz/FepE/Etk N-terminal domain-containing protein [Fererhizobium litorale]MDI7920890.1 Wzz/FepE/Etk N-terminal domain-containing protein [Fererhizobium litorale]